MNPVIKKYGILLIAGGAALVVLAAVGTGLFISWDRYGVEKNSLQGVMGRLDELIQRAPYPSMDNVRREAEHLSDLLDQYNEMVALLRRGQIEPQAMEASDFMPLLENTLRGLRERLDEAQVKYPDKCGFGFERYASGQQPASGDIPRLVQQLRMIDVICRTLADAPALELVAISRDEFEIATPAGPPAGGRRGRGPGEPGAEAAKAGPEALFSSQRFKVEFRAQDVSVFDYLNRLARLPLFLSVASVDMANQKQSVKDTDLVAAQAAAAKGPAGREGVGALPAERRVILGKEAVDVKLDLDVYQFAPPLPVAEGHKGSGGGQ